MTMSLQGKLASIDISYMSCHVLNLNFLGPGSVVAENFPHNDSEYIKIIPHPHSRDPAVKIIPLSTSFDDTLAFQPKPSSCPWAPFKSLADFEYTETAVKGLLSKELVNAQLAGINSTWATGSLLSIKNHRDMEHVLSKACKYFVQVSN